MAQVGENGTREVRGHVMSRRGFLFHDEWKERAAEVDRRDIDEGHDTGGPCGSASPEVAFTACAYTAGGDARGVHWKFVRVNVIRQFGGMTS